MEKTREEWNEFFEKRQIELPPEDFLVKHQNLLRGPRVLDLACGDGRNAFFLADLGFDVCAVDFSEVALKKIDAKGSSSIKTIAGYLSKIETIEILEDFDSILINHFIPSKEVLVLLMNKLNRDGRVFITAFDKDRNSNSFSGHSISSSDINNIFPEGEIITSKSYSNNWGFFKGIIFKKK